MDEILRLFPPRLKEEINHCVAGRWDALQEIRVRQAHSVECNFLDHFEILNGLKPTSEDTIFMLNQLSEYSLYRLEDELRQGYITIHGGHRVGLAGSVNTRGGCVQAIRDISFFNIRIAKEMKGIATNLVKSLYKKSYEHTLFVGAPKSGKTTMIRDVARIIASGFPNQQARKVGIIDERSEIAAARRGVPQHDVGVRTDVLDACPKAEGMMMMIRSMSPEVLIVDEIGSDDDVKALLEAVHAGITVICTVHGRSLEELKDRPSLKELVSTNVFKRIVILGEKPVPGSVIAIYESKQNESNPKLRC